MHSLKKYLCIVYCTITNKTLADYEVEAKYEDDARYIAVLKFREKQNHTPSLKMVDWKVTSVEITQ